MELILTETISTPGREGDIVKVKSGYGRNYLLPQGKALVATETNVAELEKNKAEIQAKIDKETALAEKVATKIQKLEIVIEQLAGEDERLFGSVTNADICAELKKQGIELDKRQILLSDPIKSLGETTVTIKVGYQVTTDTVVKVVPLIQEV